MKTASDTSLFFIEEQGVLFSESAQKIYHLNELAAFIWCLLEDEASEEAIAHSLQTTYDINAYESKRLLSETLTLFSELHVLEGTQKEVEFFTGEPVLDIIVPEITFVKTRFYRL